MKKFNTFIFDLDGTLVHTTPDYRYIIVGKTLRELGIEPQNKTIDKFWFESNRDELIKNQFDLDPVLFWKTYNNYDATEIRKQYTKVYSDIDYIQKLKNAGYKTGIVTGAPLHIASLEINLLGKEKFDVIVVAHRLNGFLPKPHPHGLKECLNLLQSQKEDTVYIGNADEDIETAKNAEVFDILLDRGEHQFPSINPSSTIHSLYELDQYL